MGFLPKVSYWKNQVLPKKTIRKSEFTSSLSDLWSSLNISTATPNQLKGKRFANRLTCPCLLLLQCKELDSNYQVLFLVFEKTFTCSKCLKCSLDSFRLNLTLFM